jgi:hypothetical protein
MNKLPTEKVTNNMQSSTTTNIADDLNESSGSNNTLGGNGTTMITPVRSMKNGTTVTDRYQRVSGPGESSTSGIVCRVQENAKTSEDSSTMFLFLKGNVLYK